MMGYSQRDFAEQLLGIDITGTTVVTGLPFDVDTIVSELRKVEGYVLVVPPAQQLS
jgi:hypothetical protein